MKLPKTKVTIGGQIGGRFYPRALAFAVEGKDVVEMRRVRCQGCREGALVLTFCINSTGNPIMT